MIRGNSSMLSELVELLESRDFRESSSHEPGHYAIERAFAEN